MHLELFVIQTQKNLKIKDRVFVIAKPLGVETNGSFSEYITIPDKWVEKLPQETYLQRNYDDWNIWFYRIKSFK